MFGKKFENLFGFSALDFDKFPNQFYMETGSIQKVLEDVLLNLLNQFKLVNKMKILF